MICIRQKQTYRKFFGGPGGGFSKKPPGLFQRILPVNSSEYNLPGKKQISYRAGTYAQFLKQMERLVRKAMLPGEQGSFPNPLRHLDLNAENDLAAALMKSWAVIGDILTFYQERLANEGYLRTAGQRKSLLELVRAIGYRFKPGLSAGTYLAFTAAEKKAAAKPLLVKAGTVVQGIPAQSLQPVTFETSETIEARPQWNRIKAYIPMGTQKQTIGQHSRVILLDNIATGLKPGHHLLITGSRHDPTGEESVQYFRSIQQVEPLLDKKKNRIGTKVELAPEPGETPEDSKNNSHNNSQTTSQAAPSTEENLSHPQIYAFRQHAVLFGSNAPEWKSLPISTKKQVGTPKGGLFYSGNDGNTWTSAAKGLPEQPVRAIAIGREGSILAGTSKGIYRSADNGQTWKAINTGLTRRDVHTLFIDHNNHFFAGSSGGGAYRSTDRGDSWTPLQDGLEVDKEHWKALSTRTPNTVFQSLISYTEPESGDAYTIAGTNNGIMRIIHRKNLWEPANDGLPGDNEHSGQAGVVVRSLAFYHDSSHIFAGTDKGLFRSKNHAKSWHRMEKGLNCIEIFSLVYCKKILHKKHEKHEKHEKFEDYIIAGTDNGIFWSNDNGHSWTPAEKGLKPAPDNSNPENKITIHCLAAYTDLTDRRANIFAGTDKGAFISIDYGQTWQNIDNDIQKNTGLKENIIPALGVNEHGALAVATPPAGVIESQWPDFSIQNNHVDLLRTQSGLVPGSRLVLKQDSPQPLTHPCTVLNTSSLIRSDFNRTAKVTRLTVSPGKGLESFDLRETQVFLQSEALPLLKEKVPEPVEFKGDSIKLAGRLTDIPVGQSIIITGHEELKNRTATSADNSKTGGTNSSQQVEVRRVMGTKPGPDGGFTELLLDTPLETAFDPESVTVCANVAPATHGETVFHEVLGSGNASKANQEFVLKKPPLTYTSGAGAEGAKSTLTVRVTGGPPHGYLNEGESMESIEEKGILWEETGSLYQSGPVSNEYMVQIDENNKTHVIFGDGEKGTRLPTGIENVTATYRSGGGSIGNVNAEQLVLLKTRILGIQKVTNPLPAQGGTDPETLENARSSAPRGIRPLERIVSIDDYRDFTRNFAGIAKASIKELWNGHNKAVHITVAGTDGATVKKDTPLYNNLSAAIHTYRAVPMPYQIDSYAPVYFNIEAKITVKPGMDTGNLDKQVRTKLRKSFDFEAGDLGCEVSASGIIALIQETTGVLAVDLYALYITDTPKSKNNALYAQPAFWDGQSSKIQPSQMLIINPNTEGIILTLEKE